MIGFRTENSIYTVDQKGKKISGGIFGMNLVDYEKLVVITGDPAEIVLKNGNAYRTSTVKYRM